jgi:2-C-methyl-D-erythritol 4-phosphate cytidylyltransferase
MAEGTGSTCGIIVAAGRAERMNGQGKVFVEVMGRPLITWTLGAFKRCDAVDDVVVVASPDGLERMRALVREWRFDDKVTAVVPGGATRQDSVRAGLEASDGAAIVAVHDGARPMVTSDMIARGIVLAREHGAALCAIRARDTVKEVSGNPPVVMTTPARDRMWLAQTPQCFDRALLIEAHALPQGSAPVTDDASLVEAMGRRVVVYEGAPSNFKVTTPEDLIVAEALLRERLNASG